MKKLFILTLVLSSILACKKKTTSPTTTNNSADTTKNTNSVTCGDNPNINYKCIGTPIGKFGDCITDIDGNVYKTVTIGSQTWMAENLKVSKYNDGTVIPNVIDSINWSKLTKGAWCNYDNNNLNNSKYGKLYNWFVVDTKTNGNKNVCPTNWHVPSKIEWDTLIKYTGSGLTMKEIGYTSWKNPSTFETNSSLFTGLPGGFRSSNGYQYTGIGKNGLWWSASESNIPNTPDIRVLFNQPDIFFGTMEYEVSGLSIRCIKD